MAITQVGSVTSGGSASSGGPFNVDKPTGVASGDLLIAFGSSNNGAWSTLPSGWTEFAVSDDADVPNNYRCYAWYKVAGGSEPSNYTYASTTAASSGAPMYVAMAAFRGVDTSDPIPNVSELAGGAIGAGTNPNPATSFSQTATGLLFYSRMVRTASPNSGVPTFTNAHSASWNLIHQGGQNSGTGNTTYSISLTVHGSETGSGSRSEPTITTDRATTDNVYVLGWLRTKLATEVPAETVSGSTTTNSPTPGVKVNAIGVGV
jgi:hypothetical protein